MMLSFIPPRPGMKAVYKCNKCGKTFLTTIPIFNFFGLMLKCPHCGSSDVIKDDRVRY